MNSKSATSMSNHCPIRLQDLTFRVKSDLASINSDINSFGISLIKDLNNKAAMLELSSKFGVIFDHPDSGEDGVTVIIPKKDCGPNTLGLSQSNLIPHTDRSIMTIPPHLLLNVMVHPAKKGGESIFIDGYELFRRLKIVDYELWQATQQYRSIIFSDGKQEVPGQIFNQLTAHSLIIRFRFDSNIYFNAVIASKLNTLLNVIHTLQQSLTLEPGTAYLINNHRWLHGRTAFEGEREVWRTLIQNPQLNLS